MQHECFINKCMILSKLSDTQDDLMEKLTKHNESKNNRKSIVEKDLFLMKISIVLLKLETKLNVACQIFQ